MRSTSLAALWHQHKHKCRSYASVVRSATVGDLPGVEPDERGWNFIITNKSAALAAMRKQQTHAAAE